MEIINLNENYRSSNEIIEIYNSLRGSKSKPMRNYSNSSYYLNNLNSEKEGEKIFELIKELIDNNKIENLSDIAVLYRSIKLGNSSLNSLITLLKEHDIPYQVQGLEDIMNNNDIKAVMTVLYYLIPSETGAPIRNRWQINWLNIKAFTGANFETSLFNLNSETKDIINDLWDDYEKLALDTFKEVYKAEKKKTSRIRTYNGIFKQNIDIINKTFEKINVPGLDDIIANINDKNDLEFFKGIDSISKKIIKNKEIKLLDIYYEVLNFLDLFNEDNKELFGNLGLISTIVYNYDLMLQNNLSRLFYFLGQILEKTDNKLDDEVDAVQLMTIHKAKGLEFPITIVASLKDEKFPKKHPDPEFKKRFVYGKPTYYIPNKFLEYKDYSQDDEVKFHDDEEERILYVALSRAQDILVLSSVENSNILENLISKNQGNIIPLTKMNKIKSVNKKEKDLINLSYSSYQKYKSCPFKYDLLFNHDFKKSVGGDETIGTIIHKTFEILNKKIKENYYTPTKEEIKKLVSKIKQNFNIEIKENEIEKIVENILYFYEEYGEMEILDAEYSFKIKNNNYVLTGAIDLIFKTGNGEIGIIDYKNTTMKEDHSYQKQLYTYLFALKNDPKYSKYEINSLNIYYIESRNLVQFEINNEDYFNLLKNFHDVARDIEEKKFDKNLDGNYCRRCYFKDLC